MLTFGVILSCVFMIKFQWTLAQDCIRANSDGGDSLPFFGDPGNRAPRIAINPIQAIIKSYEFRCCGKVGGWGAYVEPGDSKHRNVYTIKFQIWRPMSGDTYIKVGENAFPSVSVSSSEINEELSSNEQLHFQPGDRVGYYLEQDGGTNGGVQFDGDNIFNQEELWYVTGNPGLQNECRLDIGTGGDLSSSTNRGPIISVSLSTTENGCPSTFTSTMFCPTPTSSVNMVTNTSALVVMASLKSCSSALTSMTSSSTLGDAISSIPWSTLQSDTKTTSDSPVTSSMGVVPVATTTFPSPSPNLSRAPSTIPTPSTSETSSDPSTTNGRTSAPFVPSDLDLSSLIAGFVVALLVVMVIAVLTIVIIVVLMKRRRNKSGSINSTALSNPNYAEATSVKRRESERKSMATNNDDSIYQIFDDDYDYLEIPEATLPKFRTSTQNEDPFESEGIYVPTLAQRQTSGAHYELQNDSNPYNTLQFFVDDDIYWAPADTTSDLYQQLASKKYREIPRSQITILEQLGSGQFGLVCKGLWSISDNTLQLAVKTLKSNAPEDDTVKFLQEAAIMGQFRHPNVVKLYGVVTVGEPVMICLEIMSNGDLGDYLKSINMSSTTKRASQNLQLLFLRFAKEIAAGMDYLSKKAFVHRDLAARNVLVNDALTCKIGDFGMARDLMDETYYTSHGGKVPLKWTAPEALLYKKYSTDSDVWSYGMVLFEIWSVGQKPFSMHTNNEVLRLIQSGHCQCPPPGCPREIYRLMVDCWNPEHQYRPKFGMICSRLRALATKLLCWSPEDSGVSKEASVLGAPLEEGYHLHRDLRDKYKDYECI